MPLIIIFLALEIIIFLTILEHFKPFPKAGSIIALSFNFLLSIILWYLLLKTYFYKGYYDTPENISMRMNLTGMICGVVLPRFLASIFHYSGKMIRLKKGGHLRWLTSTGLVLSAMIFLITASGTFIGRFNFTIEKTTVKIRNLDKDLDGLRIVQVSDLHLASFYGHYDKLAKAIKIVNDLKPDIFVNTGDFISYGSREFDSCDTILSKAVSRYGSIAIFGNHDMGTYMPNTSLDDKADIIMKVSDKIRASGYTLLHDNSTTLKIGKSTLAILGVTTAGRHPMITHGDITKAMLGTDSAKLRIFLCHDPNQWASDVAGKTNIELTLSGHTHGMQMGIISKWIRWSPSKHYYPHWNGLYSEGNQYHYVNRGLGTLAIPFRIWMPPEITLITLRSE
jgi:uncharacterized protein